jgi:hypothetical protein
VQAKRATNQENKELLMANELQRYSAETIIIAARDLQDAAGTPEKPIEVSAEVQYTLDQAIQLLSVEIRLLHERGFSDERIADLFTSYDIETTVDDLKKFYEQSEEPDDLD